MQQQQPQQNDFSGIIALILLIKRLFCAFVNSLANTVERTEREWDLSYFFSSFPIQCRIVLKESEREGQRSMSATKQCRY